MPNRMLREGLMESERVLSLPVEARWLFVIIVLSADDVGLFEATEFKLARRADVNRELAGRLLAMLQDVDLVRFYEVDGKRYGFVPRFRQRLQLKRMKHPAPPAALVADDDDALSKINGLGLPLTDAQPLPNGCPADAQPSEAEAEAKEEISASSAKKPRRQRKAADPNKLPNCPYVDIVSLYHEVLPELPRVLLIDDADRRRAIASFWTWVLTTKRPDGTARASTAAEALGWLRQYLTRARCSDFLMGRTERSGDHKNWRCTLDFLLSTKGKRHVIEATEAA